MKDSTRVGSSERLEIPGFTLYGEASIWITSERWREGPLPKNVDFHTSAAGSCVKQDGEAIVTSGWSERRPENRGSSLTHAPKISSFFYTFREIKFYLIRCFGSCPWHLHGMFKFFKGNETKTGISSFKSDIKTAKSEFALLYVIKLV